MLLFLFQFAQTYAKERNKDAKGKSQRAEYYVSDNR